MTRSATMRGDARDPLRERLRRALPMTFLVHVTLTLLAAFPASRLARALDLLVPGATTPDSGASDPVLLLDALPDLAQVFGWDVFGALGSMLLLSALLSTPLQMAWLASLHHEPSLRGAARDGILLWPRAVVVDLVLLVPVAIGIASAALIPYAVHLGLADQPDARLHDLAVLAASLPLALMIATTLALRDLCRAALLEVGIVAAIRVGMRNAIRALPFYLLLSTLSALLLGVGALELGPLLALVVLQPLAFVRSFLRACWLAVAVSRTEQSVSTLTALLGAPSPIGDKAP